MNGSPRRSGRQRLATRLAVPAVLAFLVAGCPEVEEDPVEDPVEEPEPDPEEPEPDPEEPEPEPDEPEPEALPDDTFGPECDRILEDQEDLSDMDTLTALQMLPEFEDLVTLVVVSGLDQQLAEADQMTVFAPVAEELERLGAAERAEQSLEAEEPGDDADGADAEPGDFPTIEERDGLVPPADDPLVGRNIEEVVALHVADEALDAQQLVDQGTVSSLGPDDIEVMVADQDEVTLEIDLVVSNVVCANIQTSDGFIHAIDTMLIPREVGDGDA